MAGSAGGDPETQSSGGSERRADDGAAGQQLTRLDRSYRKVVSILQGRARKRLEASIGAFRREYESRTKLCKTPENAKSEIVDALGAADKAVGAGDIDGGWKYFHVAQRLDLLTLDLAELKAATVAMRAEAGSKLKSWRKDAVLALLDECKATCAETETRQTGAGEKPASPENGEGKEKCKASKQYRLFLAALLRDEHFNNEGYKKGLRLSFALVLAAALLFGLLILLFLARCGVLTQALKVEEVDNAFAALLTVCVIGFLGAAVSAATSIPRLAEATRIPELVGSIQVTALRLFVGPVSATVVYFVARSQAYNDVFEQPIDGGTLVVLAFVAGFTERFVRRVVEAVAGKD